MQVAPPRTGLRRRERRMLHPRRIQGEDLAGISRELRVCEDTCPSSTAGSVARSAITRSVFTALSQATGSLPGVRPRRLAASPCAPAGRRRHAVNSRNVPQAVAVRTGGTRRVQGVQIGGPTDAPTKRANGWWMERLMSSSGCGGARCVPASLLSPRPVHRQRHPPAHLRRQGIAERSRKTRP